MTFYSPISSLTLLSSSIYPLLLFLLFFPHPSLCCLCLSFTGLSSFITSLPVLLPSSSLFSQSPSIFSFLSICFFSLFSLSHLSVPLSLTLPLFLLFHSTSSLSFSFLTSLSVLFASLLHGFPLFFPFLFILLILFYLFFFSSLNTSFLLLHSSFSIYPLLFFLLLFLHPSLCSL